MNGKINKLADEKLVMLIKKGGRQCDEAFSVLYDRYSVKVRNFCQFMIRKSESVEDIFQETFIYFFKNIRDGKVISNVPAYLLSISRNLCMKYYRDKKTMVPFDPDFLTVDEQGNYERNELYMLIVNALPLLDEMYREAFIMREFEGLPYNEIAEITETSLSNAKSRVFRAHKQLIGILKPYMKDLDKKYE